MRRRTYMLAAAAALMLIAVIWSTEQAAWAQDDAAVQGVPDAASQAGNSVDTDRSIGSAAPPGPAAATGPRVVAAASTNRSGPERVQLGDWLTVTVKNLDELLRNAEGDCRRVILFFDDRPMRGVPVDACDEASGRVRFHLERDDASDEAWRDVLGGQAGTSRSVAVSVGITDGFPVATDVEEMQLVVVSGELFVVFVGLLAATLITFWVLARTTPMLRDRNATVPDDGTPKPYSLALTQMSIWLFLVITAFAFLWLVTGQLNTLSQSALVLVGVGSLTAMGASLIDRNKKGTHAQQAALVESQGDHVRALRSEQEGLAAASDKEAMSDQIAHAEAELDAATSKLEALTSPVKTGGSSGFWIDILSDKRGVSLYRFQLLAWTAVLAIVFVVSVWHELTMPEFGAVLLALMGISNGTYLGFKFPELH